MKLLNPAISLVGSLSFRNKLRATAVLFGVPLLIALSVILAGLGERVSAVHDERDALAIQLPALNLLVRFHQYAAAAQAAREGDEALTETARAERARTAAALADFERAMTQSERIRDDLKANNEWLTVWKRDFQAAETLDADGIAELHTRLVISLRTNLDRLNETAGLLVDGDASSSRLIGVLTSFIPELIDTTGKSARLGADALVKKSIKSGRRTELTLLRGKYNSLVEWSMDSLQKVSSVHPDLAEKLDDAASRLNTAYLGVQEAMTTKMLDTLDYDMTPESFLGLTRAALDASIGVAADVFVKVDGLLDDRLILLQTQFYSVVLAIVVILSLVVAGFVSAYISIMRGLNGLSDAVNTMASGDLSARVEITTQDEIGVVGDQFNRMVESLAQRTALLREKTNDIQNMLRHMPQGILTIVEGGLIHPEYSDYLETIFETREIKGKPVIDLVFDECDLGADARSQIEVTLAACIGEDRMNFDFNSHLFVTEFSKTLADGRKKALELGWSPICNELDVVEKIMLCIRDVTELRKLEAEAEDQKRELQMVGQILAVHQEKFHEFIESARRFIAENESVLKGTNGLTADVVAQLFRNMHTLKGNARTYGLLHLTDVAHEAEQAYDGLRKDGAATVDREALLAKLGEVAACVDDYASLNEIKLGRKGPGRRGSAEKYAMVPRERIEQLIQRIDSIDPVTLRSAEALHETLKSVGNSLRLLGTEPVAGVLDGVIQSLPSLAEELGKAAPRVVIEDNGIHLRTQASDLLRNVFMHLLRNSMDHGIESPAERVAAGKESRGLIRIETALADERMTLRLSDDGRGLGLAGIRRKAWERGLLPEGASCSDDEAARLIFAPGFSTASQVTEVSGRGVGMDAVQDFLKREGGKITLRFTDERVGADFRAFEAVIAIPGKYAVCLMPSPLSVAANAEEKRTEKRPDKNTAADARSQRSASLSDLLFAQPLAAGNEIGG